MVDRPAATWPFASSSRCAVIAHGEIHPASRADDLDTLEEIETVATALRELGWDPRPVPFTLDVAAFVTAVRALDPAFVFNLVESVDGSGRLIHLATSVCEHLGLPYTGAPTAAMLLTTSKLEAKRVLRLAGLPTAGWVEPAQLARGHGAPWRALHPQAGVGGRLGGHRPRRRHRGPRAVGGPLARAHPGVRHRVLRRALHRRSGAQPGRAGGSPRAAGDCRPPKSSSATGTPGRRASSAGVPSGTARRQSTSVPRASSATTARDAALHRRLEALARRCWRLFGLRGYARVDVRLDRRGRPFILEVNANPCISPDAGFLAATREVGLGTTEVVARIVRDCNLPAVATAAVPPAQAVKENACPS